MPNVVNNDIALCQRSRAYIDHGALRHNMTVIKNLAPDSYVLAMVKGNAYGHGLTDVASAIAYDADGYGVATLQEALELRQAGVTKTIVIMAGVIYSQELYLCAVNAIDLVVHDHVHLELLNSVSLPYPVRVWLKADTGMNRLGFTVSQAREVYHRLADCANVAEPIRMMTHFPSADIDESLTTGQIKHFNALTRDLEAQFSLANSAAVLEWPSAHSDWIRTGGLLYGIAPKPGLTGIELGLRPAMTVTTQIIAKKRVTKGQGIGYHHLWRAPEDMMIAIIAIGYGDGYPWRIPDNTPVIVKEKRCSIIGAVSMDFMAVDLRGIDHEVEIGQEVIIWGDSLPVESVAGHIGVNPYSLVTAMGARSPVKIAVDKEHAHYA